MSIVAEHSGTGNATQRRSDFDWVTIRQAALDVHKSREAVRKAIEKGEIQARIAGGTSKTPWLKVSLTEVRRRFGENVGPVYVPKSALRKRKRIIRTRVDRGGLHPATAAMFKR